MTDPDVPRLQVDVVVVGSGPTGAAFARTVADLVPSARVLVVEVGPVVSWPWGSHVRNIDSPAARSQAEVASQGPAAYPYATPSFRERVAAALPDGDWSVLARPGTYLLGPGARQPGQDGLPAASMSANVGGMGAHWTGACPRPGAGELIEDIPAADLQEAFDQAERLLRVTRAAYAGGPFGDEVRARLGRVFDAGRPAGRRVQPMPLAVTVEPDGRRRWSGPDVILGTPVAEGEPGVAVRPDTHCRRILHEGGTATGVEIRHRTSGERSVVLASHVMVACDAIRSPQLLWASQLRPPALGHYLNDQHQIMTVVRLAGATSSGAPDGSHPAASDEPSGVSWVPYDRDLHPFHGQVMQLDASPLRLRTDDPTPPGSIVGLGWFTAKDLRFEDRVEFSATETDWCGMPAPLIHYRLTEKDHRMVDRAMTAIGAAAAALGDVLEPTLMLPFGSSLHYQGTTRMGVHDDGHSVCDTNSRVWGTTNVYVAGNGVIPTSTACNPTLTSVALAVRAGRAVAEELWVGQSAESTGPEHWRVVS